MSEQGNVVPIRDDDLIALAGEPGTLLPAQIDKVDAICHAVNKVYYAPYKRSKLVLSLSSSSQSSSEELSCRCTSELTTAGSGLPGLQSYTKLHA